MDSLTFWDIVFAVIVADVVRFICGLSLKAVLLTIKER